MNEKFSKIGFVLSVAGGAVGLGNAWKFPTLVGQNGGSAFVILYLVLTLSVGFCIFLAEIAMGKISSKDPVNAFKTLAPKHKERWKFAGFMMITGIFVLSFYLVILGWVIRYIFVSFTALPTDINLASQIFGGYVSSDLKGSMFFYLIALFCTLWVVSKGVKSGIEKLNVWMMPTLFVLLILMLLYSVFMDGFGEAFRFLFEPNFSKIGVDSLLSALGLSLFTLCVGIGCILTYAASLDDETDMIKTSVSIVFINVLIGLMMGLIVFTFIFEFGGDPSQQGAGLVFVSLTTLFAKIGIMGNILAVLFFVSLFFAGLTSAVSMIEPFIFFLVNTYKISRKVAVFCSGVVVCLLSTLCILSMNGKFGGYFSLFGKSFFDCLDYLTSNIMLPLGAMIIAIFVGFVMKKEQIYALFGKFISLRAFKVWYFMVRFVAPVCLIVIAYYQIKLYPH
ncbi:MAG: sodium-dependent transporter [Campylobacter sp.]|nr:sodium-dependent transporter [Campylobacter sp.]